MIPFYIDVARIAFRRQLIYRWANLAGLLTNTFFALVTSYVVLALYRARPSTSGYNVHDAVLYIWLIQALTMVVLPFGWRDLMRVIRSGEVISDLSKPCDFYWYWFWREVGRACYYLLFRCIPTYIIGALLFGLGLPGGWQYLPLFGITLLLAVMLGIVYRYLYNVVAFWIVEARAVGTLAEAIGLFFAGSYVPLPFFPAWLHQFATFLPFYGLMNLPTEILLGKINGIALLLAPAGQIAWLVVLTWCARRLTQRAVRHVISQGG